MILNYPYVFENDITLSEQTSQVHCGLVLCIQPKSSGVLWTHISTAWNV